MSAELFKASYNGDIEAVNNILNNFNFSPDILNECYRLALSNNQEKIVRRFIKIPEIIIRENLIYACENNNWYEILEDLVDSGRFIERILPFATEKGHIKLVNTLLGNKKISLSNNNNRALAVASINGHYKVVERLLQDRRIGSNYGHRIITFSPTHTSHRLLQDPRFRLRSFKWLFLEEIKKIILLYDSVRLLPEIICMIMYDCPFSSSEIYTIIKRYDNVERYRYELFRKNISFKCLRKRYKF